MEVNQASKFLVSSVPIEVLDVRYRCDRDFQIESSMVSLSMRQVSWTDALSQAEE